MTDTAITITFDLNHLSSYTSEHLAALWHVAQANPAPYGDYHASNIVEKLGFEIIRRWLATTRPELYHHQPSHNLRKALTGIATYKPPADATKGTPGAPDPRWHEGTWVPKPVEVQP